MGQHDTCKDTQHYKKYAEENDQQIKISVLCGVSTRLELTCSYGQELL